jgi:uncharacterized protein YggU (UPF0235/DUF167 family)
MPPIDRPSRDRDARPDRAEIIAVRVTPRAASARVEIEDGPHGRRARVWVTVPPEDGKANAAVLALLAKALGVPKSALSVAQGAASRDKTIRIAR